MQGLCTGKFYAIFIHSSFMQFNADFYAGFMQGLCRIYAVYAFNAYRSIQRSGKPILICSLCSFYAFHAVFMQFKKIKFYAHLLALMISSKADICVGHMEHTHQGMLLKAHTQTDTNTHTHTHATKCTDNYT